MASDQRTLQVPIGRFSTITRLSPRVLRLYDERGLLVPKRDRFNNYRYYTTGQIETGLKIKMLGWMGFECAEIGEILECLADPEGNAPRIEQLFKERLARTQLEIQKLRQVEEVLQGKSALEVLSMRSTDPVIKTVPDIRVISKRERGPISATLGKMFIDLLGQINSPANQRGNVSISGPPVVLYHDLGAKIDANNADLEAAMPVVGRIAVDPGFEIKTLPGGRVVSLIHTGPYTEIEGAYGKAFEFVDGNRLRLTGPCREVYMNDPREVPESELITEIQVPVE